MFCSFQGGLSSCRSKHVYSELDRWQRRARRPRNPQFEAPDPRSEAPQTSHQAGFHLTRMNSEQSKMECAIRRGDAHVSFRPRRGTPSRQPLRAQDTSHTLAVVSNRRMSRCRRLRRRQPVISRWQTLRGTWSSGSGKGGGSGAEKRPRSGRAASRLPRRASYRETLQCHPANSVFGAFVRTGRTS